MGGTQIEPVRFVIIFQSYQYSALWACSCIVFNSTWLSVITHKVNHLVLMDWHSLRWPVVVMMLSCRVRSRGCSSVFTLWLADTPLLWNLVMSSWLAANTCRNTSCYFVLLAVCSSFTLTTISRIFS